MTETPTWTLSDALLRIVAIRLAGMVAAGLIASALPSHHARRLAPVPSVAVTAVDAAPGLDGVEPESLRDMRLHD